MSQPIEKWDDKTFVLTQVCEYGYALEYASVQLKDDKEVVLAAVKEKVEQYLKGLLEQQQANAALLSKLTEHHLPITHNKLFRRHQQL